MKKKSSLKTFLNGENPYGNYGLDGGPTGLKGCKILSYSVTPSTCFLQDEGFWDKETDAKFYIDVLDDGTAITYSPDV